MKKKKAQPKKFRQWVSDLSTYSQAKLFGIFSIFYFLAIFLWYFILLSPMLASITQTKEKLASTEQQVSIFQSQLQIIQTPSKALSKEEKEFQEVSGKLKKLQSNITEFKKDILPPRELPPVLRKLLTNVSGLELLTLDHEELSVLNKSPETGHIIYKAPFVMKLRGTFTDTLNYLTDIEKLPWRFFWDDLSYKVEKYPVGVVTIKINTLSEQKGDASE
jgi:MSHA biogenesis protein MshJ